MARIEYLSFSAEINQQTTEGLLSKCCDLSSGGVKTISIALSTTGGDVQCGINIYNVLRGLPCEIVMHNVSAVNSVGVVVFCAGDKRYANEHTSFLFHGVGFNLQNATLRLDEKFLMERLESVRSDQARLAGIISENTSIPTEEANNLFLRQGMKTPAEALECGLIQGVRPFALPGELKSVIRQAVFDRR